MHVELFERILNQKRGTKNKVYSLHEPEAYCIAKGKDHKPYEYGSKASVVSTFKDNIIIGATSHSKNVHDSKTLDRVLEQVKRIQNNYQPETALCDRGYRGKSESEGVEIMIPKAPLKRDSRYQKRKKGAYFRRRAAIEPIIGHLKSDYRLSRNYLKGNLGDEINIMMAACAFNMKKWMRWYASLLLFFFIYVSERRKKADLKSIPAV
ncbi:MAG: transposase [Proteobacteria bacterium]|nr:transposase [Pseudomonadota bacterium]